MGEFELAFSGEACADTLGRKKFEVGVGLLMFSVLMSDEVIMRMKGWDEMRMRYDRTHD